MIKMPERSDAVIDFLKFRRSNLAKTMSGPGPTKIQLDEILEIAARVPDHRKLEPWRFIVFRGEARQSFGHHLGAIYQKNNPEMPQDRVIFEAARMMRAPVVVAVISSPIHCPRGTPEWEQQLSSAAVCFNMCLTSQAYGYAAQWLTEWYAYDPEIGRLLGLTESENVSGFIYIGNASEAPTERKRPDLSHKTSIWLDNS